MSAKDIQRVFRAAPWASAQDMQQFVAQARTQVGPADIVALLDIVNTKSLHNDPTKHRARCAAFKALAEGIVQKPLFQPYVRALGSADPQVRVILAQLIPPVNNPQAHGELVALLRNGDAAVRKSAADIIRKVAGKYTIPLLTRLVTERNMIGRVEAMDLLVESSGHNALKSLEAVAVGSGFAIDERTHALQLMGNAKYFGRITTKTVRAIQRVLRDGNETVRIAAITAYTSLCAEDDYFRHVQHYLSDKSLGIVKAAVFGLRRFHTRRAILSLERKLRAGPNAIRLAVLHTLEQIGRNEVLPPLVEALSMRQIAIRNKAGEVLGRLSREGKVDIARTIVWLLRSRDVNVRRQAVELAGTVPPGKREELWPKLLRALHDEDWWVRERVIDALVELAGPKLTRHMVGYLKDGSDVLRRFAVGVLGKLKDPQALGTLVKIASDDPDWWVREKAIESIGAIGDKRAVPYLLKLIKKDPDLTFVALQSLADLDATDHVEQVADFLKSDDPDVIYASLKCLAKLDDPAPSERVKPLITHNRSQIRELSRDLLRRWQIKVAAQNVMSDDSITLLDRYLIHTQEEGGEDLILQAGKIPVMKKLGQVVKLSSKPLSAKLVESLLLPSLSGKQLKDLDRLKDVDFSYEVQSRGLRFRANVFASLSGISAVFREVKDLIPKLEDLGVPEIVQTMGDYKNGLVLMGGPTGSGKSTTLAALINYINQTYDRHIISIEDPVEVVHRRKKGLVSQRELHTHTGPHTSALRATLRQDPDVILVGELRDYPTIAFAVSAAETGHLVFGTVHTATAATTVDRLINAFPGGQAEQVRSMLADSLRAVVCQHLLRRVQGGGRVLAAEIMLNNEAISNLIRKGKAHQIPSMMSAGASLGMKLMDDSLMELYKGGNVYAEEVYMKAINKKDFEGIFDPTKVGVQATVKLAGPRDRAESGQGAAPWDPGAPPKFTLPEEKEFSQDELLLEDEAEAAEELALGNSQGATPAVLPQEELILGESTGSHEISPGEALAEEQELLLEEEAPSNGGPPAAPESAPGAPAAVPQRQSAGPEKTGPTLAPRKERPDRSEPADRREVRGPRINPDAIPAGGAQEVVAPGVQEPLPKESDS